MYHASLILMTIGAMICLVSWLDFNEPIRFVIPGVILEVIGLIGLIIYT